MKIGLTWVTMEDAEDKAVRNEGSWECEITRLSGSRPHSAGDSDTSADD